MLNTLSPHVLISLIYSVSNEAGNNTLIFILWDNPSTVTIEVAVLPVPNPWYTNNPRYGESVDKYSLENNWCNLTFCISSLSSIFSINSGKNSVLM